MGRILATATIVLASLFSTCAAVQGDASVLLGSESIRASINARTAGLVGVDNLTSAENHIITSDNCRLETDGGAFDLNTVGWKLASRSRRSLCFVASVSGIEVRRVYTVYPKEGYFDRTFSIKNNGSSDIVVKRVIDANLKFAASFISTAYHSDNTTYANSINVFLRNPKGTLCIGLKYPYFKADLANDHVSLAYEVNHRIKPGESLELPTMFCAACNRVGHKVRKQIDTIKPRILTTTQEIMDLAEVQAMQRVVKDYVVQEPLPAPGYFIAFDAYWGKNELAVKMGEKEVRAYMQLVDLVKMSRCIDILCPAGCWDGIQEYGQPAAELDAIGDDAKFPMNSYVQTVLNKIKSEHMLVAGYCEGNAPSLNYRKDKPEWKWQFGPDPSKRSVYNCHANPAYEDWFYRLICNTIDTLGLSRWSWDTSWFLMPAVCFCTDHGHEPGDTSFDQYRCITNTIQRLRQRYPKMQMCSFWGLKEGNPWSLRGINSQENFYENGSPSKLPSNLCVADDLRFQHWYNHNYRFLPTYTNMAQIYFGRDQKRHLYSLFSCLNASTHASLCDWTPFTTQEEADKVFGPMRTWKKWASDNIEYLKECIDLFGQPCRKDGIDGTAHVIGDRGFIFVFNPNADAHWGSIPLDEQIGLKKGSRYSLDEISTGTNKRMGVYNKGGQFVFQIEPNSAILIQIKPTNERVSKTNVPADVQVQPAFPL